MSHITKPTLSIGVALNNGGWHPAALSEPHAPFDRILTAEYWSELLNSLEVSAADYVTVEAPPVSPSTPHWATPPEGSVGSLDPLLTLAWVAPRTQRLGLIPVVDITYAEPFHVATSLQTLDHFSSGRAGVQLRISRDSALAAAFGRNVSDENTLLDDAVDVAEVIRRLWLSWDIDAVIRDSISGRFLDRERLHPVNFAGKHFSVSGPSIVPRSPQGELPITVLATTPSELRLAARFADVVFVTPESGVLSGATGTSPTAERAARSQTITETLVEVRSAETAAGRSSTGRAPLHVVADLLVAFDTPHETGAARLDRLTGVARARFVSEARVVTGTVETVADLIARWSADGIDGVRLRPLTIHTDVKVIVEQLIPELSARGVSADQAQTGTLRERFALSPSPERIAEFAGAAA